MHGQYLSLTDYKPMGQKRVIVVDCVPEKRHNIELLLNALKLPEIYDDFQTVCDLKLVAMIMGLQSFSSVYGCPYCKTYKIDIETNSKTNRRGIYVQKKL